MSAHAHVMRPQTFRNFTLPKPRLIEPAIFVRRHELPKEMLAAEADTQGWDSASAVRLTQVNAALAKSGVSPKEFALTMMPGWSVDGTFGPWVMARGGSGSIVFLRTPLPTARMQSVMGNMEITNGWVTIQVKLKFLPQPQTVVDPKVGDPNDLLTDGNARSGDDPAVVIQNINYGDKPVPEELKALFQAAIGKWYNANLSVFNYVFAVVSLNQISDSPQFQWLKPTYTSYAYYDGQSDDPNPDTAYFGALTMTGGRNPDGLANQLPASAIPQDQGAALLIGMRLYMENMVLPGVTAAFPGSGPSDFTLGNTNTSIELKHDIDMAPVRVGAIDYTPTAQQFILQIVGDEIQTRSKFHVPISPGLDAYVTTESWYRIELVKKPDGSQTLNWVESRPQKKDHWYTKETWVIITEVIVAIIGAIAVIVAGAALQGVVRVIVMIIIGIIAGIAAATPELIARAISDGAANALPSINAMLSEFLAPVQWPKTTGFELKAAQLNGSFQLSGSFIVQP